MVRLGVVLSACLLCTASAFASSFESQVAEELQRLRVVRPEESVDATLLREQDAYTAAMIDRSLSSVATIVVSMSVDKFSLLALTLRRPYRPVVATMLGTGWVVREGLIVTNNHVVDGRQVGETVVVQFRDHVNLEAVVVAKNPRKDLALIRFESKPARPALPLGTSMDLRPGQRVVALGSPKGLRETATAGIFSRYGFHDEIGPGRYLQIDADINHGNSGGPLVDLDGRVIGVNFAGPEKPGIGWSIPVEYVKQALRQYDETKKLVNARFGAQLEPAQWVPQSQLPRLRAKDTIHETGAWIKAVPHDTPAAKAGLKAGDRVVAVDGADLPEPAYDAERALKTAVADRIPGETLQLLIERDGKRQTVVVVLGAAEDDQDD